MDAAKASVKKFMSSSGHHDTSVHEKVAPAVQQETINREQHERQTTAVDKEVHQDHYHTTVQPVKDSEVLPEQHHHNMMPTEHRSFEHDNSDSVKRSLDTEQAKYYDTTSQVEGRHTTTAEPTVAGEHVHHHVHETIQPVVQKQTVEPHVMHTTVPVHEVHHNESKHHASSALPAVSMDDFKKSGGALTGRDERHDRFDGCPPEQISGNTGGHSSSTTSSAVPPTTGSSTSRDLNGTTSNSSSMAPNTITDTKSSSSGGPFNSHKHDPSLSQSTSNSSGHQHPTPASYGNDMHTENTSSTSQSKPSMMDKLNPKMDADGDGKSGMMS
ncbi:uncharacterized protein LTR77_003391 [Saxophila tyrrhenica]|uniref:Allergen n=1 Tax=Saxophila tyrrhenica TaxID=1690608 RepID=A0AAV9PDV1_9PEZI|nr:hypothetical protein LTR77_003391 [Saxophila tyrrhenica]